MRIPPNAGPCLDCGQPRSEHATRCRRCANRRTNQTRTPPRPVTQVRTWPQPWGRRWWLEGAMPGAKID